MTPTTGRPILTRIAFVLLWLFVFTIPMTLATEIPMIGTVSRAVGLAALGAGAIAVAVRRQIRLLEPVHMAMAGFILWSTVTLCWSAAPDLTVQRVTTYLQLFVLVLLVWELCVEEKNILRILSAFVLGTMVPALLTLNGFLPGQQTLLRRASLQGYDPNQLAFLLALSLPAAYYLILREKGPIVSLYRLQMGFAFCAILLTGSVSSMIAMAVGLSLAFWTFDTISIRTRTNAFVIVVMLAGATMVLVPSPVWQGIAEQTRKGDLTLTAVMNKGIDGVHSTPIGGLGAGTQARPAAALSSTSTNASAGASTPFTMFAETGVVGVMCFMAVLVVLVLAAERMSGVDKSFWFTSLAVWVVAALSLNWDGSQPAWLIFGLLAAHSACLNAERVAKVELERKRYFFEEQAEAWS